MPLTGEYEPSPASWVREQVQEYEASGGTRRTTLRDTNLPVVVVTYMGGKTGKLRKTALMRVEHDGRYALIASQGGAPKHPQWYFSLTADPHIEIQDGPTKRDYRVREVSGDERSAWWDRSVDAYPDYADYQKRTSRVIPVLVAEPTD